ncbi:MAG: hypothetical protein LBB48_02690, partial [Treponema sp.]|nr:hypothetical protein [Treponema sp.]
DTAVIKGNAADQGGGVGLYGYGLDIYFYMAGGVIYGNAEGDAASRNTATEGAALYRMYSYDKAEYGSFNGDTWVKAGDILPNEHGAYTDDAVRVKNGVLQ